MPWQDIILMAGNVIFIFSLIPSILTKDKPSFWTSIISAIVLYIFVVTYFSLGLWGSGLATLIVASLWATLAVQKFLIDRKSK